MQTKAVDRTASRRDKEGEKITNEPNDPLQTNESTEGTSTRRENKQMGDLFQGLRVLMLTFTLLRHINILYPDIMGLVYGNYTNHQSSHSRQLLRAFSQRLTLYGWWDTAIDFTNLSLIIWVGMSGIVMSTKYFTHYENALSRGQGRHFFFSAFCTKNKDYCECAQHVKLFFLGKALVNHYCGLLIRRNLRILLNVFLVQWIWHIFVWYGFLGSSRAGTAGEILARHFPFSSRRRNLESYFNINFDLLGFVMEGHMNGPLWMIGPLVRSSFVVFLLLMFIEGTTMLNTFGRRFWFYIATMLLFLSSADYHDLAAAIGGVAIADGYLKRKEYTHSHSHDNPKTTVPFNYWYLFSSKLASKCPIFLGLQFFMLWIYPPLTSLFFVRGVILICILFYLDHVRQRKYRCGLDKIFGNIFTNRYTG
ncbi:hypothetical protein RFI_11993 [Reticulomyxa filosa]|uniref:Uncharacterized protein n=1 Tax=Reticulomyxa filosa TaxID=46433 RepID=X6NFP9_RETFI|nr:hypothetical protein RFI_11993 [Reticulomyxa filosa]|eukprot:ETO25150.1 hypothetical protein RFI_11993 [Reticulomyxa filosa]